MVQNATNAKPSARGLHLSPAAVEDTGLLNGSWDLETGVVNKVTVLRTAYNPLGFRDHNNSI